MTDTVNLFLFFSKEDNYLDNDFAESAFFSKEAHCLDNDFAESASV